VELRISPSTLSGWQRGAFAPPLNDPRALRLAARLGVAEAEAFERPTAEPAAGSGDAA
jgi:hypothetical protein